MSHQSASKTGVPIRAFTLPEVLVVIAIIALLIAVLIPAISAGKRTTEMAKSQNNMRQISSWMTLYSGDNRDYIVPSRFDYTASAASGYPVKVRSNPAPNVGQQYHGTWTDILWTYHNLGANRELSSAINDVYEFDSPDHAVYQVLNDYKENAFRSSAPNSRDFEGGDGKETPVGCGAQEAGLPGYFAANDFFNTDPAALPCSGAPVYTGWIGNGQIKKPDRSMYLVDSLAGETIEPIDAPFKTDMMVLPHTLEVDFRYSGACLMLFLDGHSSPQTPWTNLADLQGSRRIKVTSLLAN